MYDPGTMFTGIVRHVGQVRSATPTAAGARLTIDLGPLAEGLALGDSVAVDGACLTATAIDGASVSFDAVRETLAKTTLGTLKPGSRVNLERALGVGATLDGHIVQGHVDGVATVKTVTPEVWTFSAPRELAEQIVPKGSVAVTGVSLTVVDAGTDSFSVALIPTTLAETTLGELRVGQAVNIETDVIGKYVMRYLQNLGGARPGGLTLDALRQAGF